MREVAKIQSEEEKYLLGLLKNEQNDLKEVKNFKEFLFAQENIKIIEMFADIIENFNDKNKQNFIDEVKKIHRSTDSDIEQYEIFKECENGYTMEYVEEMGQVNRLINGDMFAENNPQQY